MYSYSGSTGGFYLPAVHGDAIPSDALPVSDETYAAMMAAAGAGKVVVRGEDGGPVLSDPVPRVRAPLRRIAALAFRRRLAPATRAAITLAASAALDGGDATLQVVLDDLSSAQVIDLDDAETVGAVDLLQAAGLVTDAERAALFADGQESEAA